MGNIVSVILLIFCLGVATWLLVRLSKSGILHKVLASFDNTTDGFSARKLSAFAGVIVSIIATFRFVDDKTIIEALMVWLVFALLCLGIVTAEQVLRFYKGGDTSKGDEVVSEEKKIEEKIESVSTEVKPEELPKI